jgi:hypothetical protein
LEQVHLDVDQGRRRVDVVSLRVVWPDDLDPRIDGRSIGVGSPG